MLSVKNLGGGGGTSLKMEILGMYYDTGSTSGKPMDMQSIYGYYDIIPEPKSFICIDGSLEKPSGTATLSSDYVTLNSNNLTSTVTISNATGEILGVTSSDSTKIGAVLEGNVITISSINQDNGTFTVNVSIAESSEYAAATLTITVVGAFTSASFRTMTVKLDLSDSNPNTWATYYDDAVDMEVGSDAWDEFFGHYPCILENGVELGKLKVDDFSKYRNGSNAPISTIGKDVMIAFPRMGIKISQSGDILTVSMTDEDNKSGYSYKAHTYKGIAKDKFYLGAYKGYVSSNKLYSVSGQKPSASITIGNFRSYAQARGTGYEQSAYYQLIFRQVMYLLKYKGQNARIMIGKGYVDENAVYGACGYTNNKGMDWGESTGKYPMKLFGLEDFYGNIFEFIDGIYSNSNRSLLASDGNYNNTGSGYTTISSATASSNWSGYMRYPVGTNDGGFAPLVSNTNKGSGTTYFCSYAFVTANRLATFGSAGAGGNIPGVFGLNVTSSASITAATLGARLMFFPS